MEWKSIIPKLGEYNKCSDENLIWNLPFSQLSSVQSIKNVLKLGTRLCTLFQTNAFGEKLYLNFAW